jgi:hypothetical protein
MMDLILANRQEAAFLSQRKVLRLNERSVHVPQGSVLSNKVNLTIKFNFDNTDANI